MKVIIVTGLSGAGKSVAVDALEDIGYFCADNMPPKLIPTFVGLAADSREKRDKVAIVSDIRASGSFYDLFCAIDELKAMKYDVSVLYFDALDEVLVRRFKETRRKHPLLEQNNGSVIDAIQAEREILQPVRQIADYVIDSSNIMPAECKEKVASLFLENPNSSVGVHCVSFGYKYGIPGDSDLVFDVRCLPNPFYELELKQKTGLDEPVRDFVMKWPQSKEFLSKILDLVDYLLPFYKKEGKSTLVIAVGCTGGRHRSVVFAEKIFEHLNCRGYLLSIKHRDIKK